MIHYAPELAALVDAGRELPAGGRMETEIRACAVHACERLAPRLGVPPRILDNWLWNRGQQPPYAKRPAHPPHPHRLLLSSRRSAATLGAADRETLN